MSDKQQGIKEHQIKVVDKRRVGKDKNAVSVEPNLKPTYVEQLENKVAKMESALKTKSQKLRKNQENQGRGLKGILKRDLKKNLKN